MTQIPVALCCPYCSSPKFKKNGKLKNVQRYKCKACDKQFKDSTNSPLHWLHKTKSVDKYLEALRLGLTVRKAAEYSGISKGTSFAWRHKFLSSLISAPFTDCRHPKTKAKTITFFSLPHSNKGKSVPIPKNRNKSVTILQMQNNQISMSKIDNVKYKTAILKTITSTGSHCFVKVPSKMSHSIFCRLHGAIKIERKELIKEQISAIKDEQQKIMNWMERFHGVATKYLQQYWNWYVNLNNLSMLKNVQDVFCEECVSGKTLWEYRRLKQL